MKFIIAYFIIAFVIIDGVQNAPAIHPIHVQTIPLHPVSTRRTIDPSKHSSWYSSSSTQSTELTSSSTPSETTHHHSSGWNNPNSAVHIFFRIVLYAFLMFLVSKLIGKLCKSKKEKKSPVVVTNKMCISTIDGQREESPPAYANIHKI